MGMNKNHLSLVVKSQAGGTWPDADFNLHQKVRHVLGAALDKFNLESHLTYEVLLVRGTEQRSLPLDESLEGAGVRDGDLLLVRTVGRTVDGGTRA